MVMVGSEYMRGSGDGFGEWKDGRVHIFWRGGCRWMDVVILLRGKDVW